MNDKLLMLDSRKSSNMPPELQTKLGRSRVAHAYHAGNNTCFYVAIPFLDHIIQNLSDRFSRLSLVASSLLKLVPSILCTTDVDLSDAVEMYKDDMPSPELFETEPIRWKFRFQNLPTEGIPSSPANAIKVCPKDYFPNIHILLQLACTLPVTSCACERSASSLRRLKTYTRASMGVERLSGLALLHIHYKKEINLEEVVDIYSKLHPRRLEFASLL